MKIRQLAIVLLALAITACASMQAFYDSNEIAFDAGVKAGTLAVIDGDRDRADRVIDIANQIKSEAAEHETVTAQALDTIIRSKVPWDTMTAELQILADELVRFLVSGLTARVQRGELEPDYSVLTIHVADVVIETARRVNTT